MPYKDPEARRAYAKKYYSTYRSRNAEKWRAYESAWKRAWRADDTNREKERESSRRYRQNNPERVREYEQRSYRRQMADPIRREKRRALDRAWRKRNPHMIRAGWERWKQRNADRLHELWRIWAAKRRHAAGELTEAKWRDRLAYYGYCCAYCHTPLDGIKYEMDHVIPIKHGGTNWPANFVPACISCNRKKHTKHWAPRPVWLKR